MRTLTIGLPFYNNAATLRDAIRAVFSQTFQDWELVLMDDGSTDGSLEIAHSVSDPRVRVVSDGVNRGLVHRLNQIAQIARGKYLARMDADDLMVPERLKKQLDFLEQNPTVDLADCAMYSIDQDGNPGGIRGTEPLDDRPAAALKHALLNHATVVGHTAWFKNNPYDPLFVRAEDYELWCRTCKTAKFGRITEPLYLVREGRVNLRNYLKSGQTCRLIYRTYGPEFVGRVDTAKLIAMSHLKGFAYQMFGIFGAHDIIVRKRSKRLRTAEKYSVVAIIRNILSVRVPGLSRNIDDQPLKSPVV